MPVPPVSDRFRAIRLYQFTAQMRLVARQQNRPALAEALTQRLTFLQAQIGRV